MPLITVPGGWCLTWQGNAFGVSALTMYNPNLPLPTWLGGILAELQGGTAQAVQRVVQAMVTATNDNAPNLVGELPEAGELILALWAPNALLLEMERSALQAVVGALGKVKNTDLPAGVDTARSFAFNYTNAIAQDLEAGMQQSLAQAEDYTNAIAHDLEIGDQQTYQGAVNYTNAIAHDLEIGMQQAVVGVENYANAVGDQATAYAATVAGDVATYAQQETGQLAAELQATQQWAAQQIATTRTQAADDIAAGERQVVANLGLETQQQLAPIWPTMAPAANAARAGLLTEHPATAPSTPAVSLQIPPTPQLALAGLAAAIIPLAKTAVDCALPYCQTKNRNAKQLHTLTGPLGLGVLLAVIAGAAADPHGAAHTFVDVAATPAKAAFDGARSLFGR